MDIKFKATYPACALSNFAAHPFEIDGIKCASMEGFLQSLKFKDPHIQKQICCLKGSEAKDAGLDQDWQSKQTLYWKNQPLDRHSQNYQLLIDRAYAEMASVKSFQQALLASKNHIFTHIIGESDPYKTILTERELCDRLNSLRTQAQAVNRVITK